MGSPADHGDDKMDVDSTTTKKTTTPPQPPKKKPKNKLLLTPSASGEQASKFPNMELSQNIHRVTMLCTGELDPEEALSAKNIDINVLPQKVMDQLGLAPPKPIEKKKKEKEEGDKKKKKKDDDDDDEEKKEDEEPVENPTVYRHLRDIIQSSTTLPQLTSVKFLTEEELSTLDTKHVETMKDLVAKVDDAKDNAGEMEVLQAKFDIARFASKSLSKEEALEAYEDIVNLPKLSSGKQIDAIMESARVASFHGDTKKNTELVERAVKMAGDGGDWDRRNRLKVYSAMSKILARNVKDAASLLIDCVATFSCTELCSYQDFITYTILTNILHLPRTELKAKIIDGPEILSIVDDISVVYKLVKSLYDCDYKTYLQTMVSLHPILLSDRFLQPHCGYLLRELHVLGYKQFLDSYKSVTLSSMALSFGVGTEFLDLQLSRFIAAGRLTAKIDKFGGVVETNRPDLKNAQYRDMIQRGDLLLNRIQKLARVVDL